MEGGTPPDPRSGGCSEVGHRQALLLRRDQKGQLVLHNRTTGEVALIQSSTPVELHFAENGMAYITTSSGNTWANELLAWSVWQTEANCKFIFRAAGAHSWQAWWVHELETRFESHALALEPACQESCTVFRYMQPRADSGMCLFWDMIAMMAGLGLPATREYIGNSLRHRWGRTMASHRCPREQHVLRAGDTDACELLSSGVRILGFSTRAMLLVLGCLDNIAARNDKAKANGARALTRSLISRCCFTEFRMAIRVDPTSDSIEPLVPHSPNAYALEVRAGKVDMTALCKSEAWKTKTTPQFRKYFPFSIRSCCCELADVMGSLALRPQSAWLYDQLVVGLAAHVEEVWPLVDVPLATTVPPSQLGSCCRDPAQRRKLAMEHLAVANMRRKRKRPDDECDTAEMPPVKSSGPKVNFKVVSNEARRYLLASRRAFSGASAVAYSCDASRLGSRSRLVGCFLNLVTGDTCWGPPQDSGRSSAGTSQFQNLSLEPQSAF